MAIDVDTHQAGRHLVFLDRLEGAANARTTQAGEAIADDRQDQHDMPSLGDQGNAVEALRPPGDVQIEDDDTADLAEGQSRHGQINA